MTLTRLLVSAAILALFLSTAINNHHHYYVKASIASNPYFQSSPTAPCCNTYYAPVTFDGGSGCGPPTGEFATIEAPMEAVQPLRAAPPHPCDFYYPMNNPLMQSELQQNIRSYPYRSQFYAGQNPYSHWTSANHPQSHYIVGEEGQRVALIRPPSPQQAAAMAYANQRMSQQPVQRQAVQPAPPVPQHTVLIPIPTITALILRPVTGKKGGSKGKKMERADEKPKAENTEPKEQAERPQPRMVKSEELALPASKQERQLPSATSTECPCADEPTVTSKEIAAVMGSSQKGMAPVGPETPPSLGTGGFGSSGMNIGMALGVLPSARNIDSTAARVTTTDAPAVAANSAPLMVNGLSEEVVINSAMRQQQPKESLSQHMPMRQDPVNYGSGMAVPNEITTTTAWTMPTTQTQSTNLTEPATTTTMETSTTATTTASTTTTIATTTTTTSAPTTESTTATIESTSAVQTSPTSQSSSLPSFDSLKKAENSVPMIGETFNYSALVGVNTSTPDNNAMASLPELPNPLISGDALEELTPSALQLLPSTQELPSNSSAMDGISSVATPSPSDSFIPTRLQVHQRSDATLNSTEESLTQSSTASITVEKRGDVVSPPPNSTTIAQARNEKSVMDTSDDVGDSPEGSSSSMADTGSSTTAHQHSHEHTSPQHDGLSQVAVDAGGAPSHDPPPPAAPAVPELETPPPAQHPKDIGARPSPALVADPYQQLSVEQRLRQGLPVMSSKGEEMWQPPHSRGNPFLSTTDSPVIIGFSTTWAVPEESAETWVQPKSQTVRRRQYGGSGGNMRIPEVYTRKADFPGGRDWESSAAPLSLSTHSRLAVTLVSLAISVLF